MGAMLDGSVLYDESRMDTLEKRSDELYKELYGKEWFGKMNRYDRILGDAGEAVKEFLPEHRRGEVPRGERHNLSPPDDRRRAKARRPKLGDADTVFADDKISAYVDVDADGNPVTVIKTAENRFDSAENRLCEHCQKAHYEQVRRANASAGRK